MKPQTPRRVKGEFGTLLRKHRTTAKRSIADLARAVGVDDTSLSPMEREARVALTLRLLGGQRIVRAKRTLAEKRIPFEVPRRAELAARLSSVFEVIYLIFNEGYAATVGEDWLRPGLCEDALVALMEIQASRSRARLGPSGEPILLFDQNRAQWDQLVIRRGLAALANAEELGSAQGPYVLQAEIAACHARARTAEETDWPRIVMLYEALARVAPSPVIELNRAVAVAMASGPAAGLELVDALREEGSLENYHLLASVRGDLLQKAEPAGRGPLRVRARGIVNPERT
jgi:predicted RNA polymerase sigma factor